MDTPRSRQTSLQLSERLKELGRSKYAVLEAKFMANGPIYTVLLTFVLANIILFGHGLVLEAEQHSNFKRYTTTIARGCGYMLNLNVGLILLVASRSTMTMLRNTPLNMLIPFDSLMPGAHMFLGYVCFLSGVFHGIFHFIPGVIAHSWQGGLFKWTYEICTGFTMLTIFSVMLFFTRRKIRTLKFEVFYHVHLAGAVLFFSLLSMHGLLFGKPYTWKWFLPFVILYIADRIYRKLLERQIVLGIDLLRSMSFADGDILKFSIPKCMEYKAGQWVELCIPVLSEVQWHPFTIASAPSEKNMTFFIRTNGDWCGQLRKLVGELKESAYGRERSGRDDENIPPAHELRCRIRGPYGAPAQHTGQFRKVVLISGGVGGTPFLSVVKDMVRYLDKQASSSEKTSSQTSSHADTAEGCHESLPELSRNRASAEDVALAEYPSMSVQNEAKSSRCASYVEDNECDRSNTTGTQFSDKENESSDDESAISCPSASNLQRIQYFLASTTVAFFILWLEIFRLFNTVLPLVLDLHLDIRKYGGFQVLPRCFQIADFVLATTVAVLSALVIASELASQGDEIRLVYKIVDITVVLPVVFAPVATGVCFLAGAMHGQATKFWILYCFVMWPLSILAVVYRHLRNGAGTTVIASSIRSSYENTLSVEFIYTAPDRRSDDWLVNELIPYSTSRHFKLQRYLTREIQDEEVGSQSVERFTTRYGRPVWDTVIEEIVQATKSGSSIGVFFCGPKPMEIAVREACYSATVRSRRRGMYYGVSSYAHQSSSSHHSSHGCNIRLSMRSEKF
jgi:predicted ferric reductase